MQIWSTAAAVNIARIFNLQKFDVTSPLITVKFCNYCRQYVRSPNPFIAARQADEQFELMNSRFILLMITVKKGEYFWSTK